MNKANTIKKIALAASILLAAALAFSCSSDDGEANEPSSSSANISSSSSSSYSSSSSLLYSSSSSIGETTGDSSSSSSGDGQDGSLIMTEIYALGHIDDSFFVYSETYEWYDCKEDGTIERRIHWAETVSYSISDNTLVWLDYWQADMLHFSGTSNNLIGTWTRTKSIDSDIVKAEFTDDTLKVTRDFCIADEIDEDDDINGWEAISIDCNTYEESKGTEKVTIKAMLSNNGSLALSYTYNGKTCYWNQEFTPSRSQAACTEAWNKAQAKGGEASYYYHNIVNGSEVYACMRENGFPADFWGEDDENEESAMPKTLMKKAKVKAKMLKM